MRLLLAEDERELSSALAAILKHSNYSVDAVYDGADALDYGLAGGYDGIILDIMMPKRDGLSVLRELRAQGVGTPVLLLTARGQVEDRIQGLDTGADDYLVKPFAMGELLARIRAMTRRKGEFSPNTLAYGGLTLDRECFELSCGSSACRLGNREFQIMELLMTSPRRLFSTEFLLEKIWGWDGEAEVNVVWVYISNLRKKLAALDSPVEIRAARGLGYTLEVRSD